ncbi:hypothetical protein CDL15_Pgr018763 [Punica granatum]|nr:hypothetical protein CDL15_Pgr018763 [Punica granatum]
MLGGGRGNLAGGYPTNPRALKQSGQTYVASPEGWRAGREPPARFDSLPSSPVFRIENRRRMEGTTRVGLRCQPSTPRARWPNSATSTEGSTVGEGAPCLVGPLPSPFVLQFEDAKANEVTELNGYRSSPKLGLR